MLAEVKYLPRKLMHYHSYAPITFRHVATCRKELTEALPYLVIGQYAYFQLSAVNCRTNERHDRWNTCYHWCACVPPNGYVIPYMACDRKQKSTCNMPTQTHVDSAVHAFMNMG